MWRCIQLGVLVNWSTSSFQSLGGKERDEDNDGTDFRLVNVTIVHMLLCENL